MIRTFFLFAVTITMPALISAQADCDDLSLNADTLWTSQEKLFSGLCVDYDLGHHVLSKSYIWNGLEDSVVFLYRNGMVKSVETYKKRKPHGIFRTYYEDGKLRQTIEFKEGSYLGFWREYYRDGKIKYEAEYIEDEKLANNSYKTWNEKGEQKDHLVNNKELAKQKSTQHKQTKSRRSKNTGVKTPN